MTGPQDVQSTLAEMDRKLRELQQELDRLAVDPGPGPAETALAQAPAATTAPASPPAVEATAPSAVPAMPAQAPPMPPARVPAPPTASERPAPSAPPSTTPEPAPPTAPAEPAASPSAGRTATLLDEAVSRTQDLVRQIDELRDVAGELEQAARELGEQRRADEPQSGGGEQLFEGEIVVNAGPFADIASLGTFERGLAGLAEVDDVRVRGFEGSNALFELRLEGPVRLVEEIRRSLALSIEVVDARPGMLRLRVEPAP